MDVYAHTVQYAMNEWHYITQHINSSGIYLVEDSRNSLSRKTFHKMKFVRVEF